MIDFLIIKKLNNTNKNKPTITDGDSKNVIKLKGITSKTVLSRDGSEKRKKVIDRKSKKKGRIDNNEKR